MPRKKLSKAKRDKAALKTPTKPMKPREPNPEEEATLATAQAVLLRLRKVRKQIDKRNEARRAEFRALAEKKEREMDELRKEIGKATLEIERILNDLRPKACETRKAFEVVLGRKRWLELRRRQLYREIEEARAKMQASLEPYPPEADDGQLFEAFEAKIAVVGLDDGRKYYQCEYAAQSG